MIGVGVDENPIRLKHAPVDAIQELLEVPVIGKANAR